MEYPRRKQLTVDDYVQGVLNKERVILAQAITLIESGAAHHRMIAEHVLSELMPYTGQSIRIGITGAPGVGKSSLIERLGLYLCEKGYKVAVLAIDPSSTVNYGSILGDKTRMEELVKHPNSYIRPTASRGALGGVARKTRESMYVCEAAGYQIVIIETVGVGQSEVMVEALVDFLILLMITGAGDDLQNLKKGIIELADMVAVTKADGENIERAVQLTEHVNETLKLSISKGKNAKALAVSALTGEGITELWDTIKHNIESLKRTNQFASKRKEQWIKWLNELIEIELLSRFYEDEKVKKLLPNAYNDIKSEKKTVIEAASTLLKEYERRQQGE
ncbi:methylmalonyl Co-A mutase-associated GTPase MeaB [Halalkalibacter urbisdiaboli]|uniref:methylmalonyl Co-A mutase-associated GTPase MeaB n=1 Tax=Halalkalibacter urbisdiaboli TaxID=1960589 RepID=UPI0013FD350B|nr:methylmalonyl Co-A mutase-associated GTPase MeaB [Halalkalibacter urbisdiaboli]